MLRGRKGDDLIWGSTSLGNNCEFMLKKVMPPCDYSAKDPSDFSNWEISEYLSDAEEKSLIENFGLAEDHELLDVKPEWLRWISEAKFEKIRRPCNAFILYSVQNRKAVAANYPNRDNRFISKQLAVLWKKLSLDEQKVYVEKFNAKMTEIRKLHPEWNYAASRAKKHAAKNEQKLAFTKILDQRLRPKTRNICYYEGSMKRHKQATKNPLRRQVTTRKSSVQSKSPQKVTTLEKFTWVMCDYCSKWRRLKISIQPDDLPKFWFCTLNSDPEYSSCEFPEEAYD